MSGGCETRHRGGVRWLRGVGLAVALAGAFLIVATIGVGEVQRGTRVLAALDLLVAWIASSGGGLSAMALAHQTILGWACSAAAAAIALLGVIRGRRHGGVRRGGPLLVLAAAVSLAVWGQIELLADHSVAGVWLYAAGFVCAVWIGAWYPLTRLPGLPRWPFPEERPAAACRGWSNGELALVFGLTVLALLSRVYALPELPDNFDEDNGLSMVASHTLAGLRVFLPWGLLKNSPGAVHLFTQLALFRLFGTSVYVLRLAAVFHGVAAVPLCYWLARRVAGPLAAVVAAVLFIAAPEQLFWSRTEDTHFAPVAVAALVTAHLGLWLTERVSVMAVLAAALWMPACRFFYAPAMLLFAYPLALYVHAVMWVRGAWRTAWYAVPLLAGGAALWFFSLSIADASLNHWQWRFVDPTGDYGAGAWTQQGQLQGASLPEFLRLRALSTAANFWRVATAMASNTSFSIFYVRADATHPTLVNVGLLVLAVLGVGYLLGQAWERRAFALLLWVGLGLLPALLSNDPVGRRMSVMFPALYVIAGVFGGAMVRLARRCAGRPLAWATSGVLGMTALGVAWASLASHLLLPIGPLPVEEAFRFTQPLFEDSDVIFHNLDWNSTRLFGRPAMGPLMVFGNLAAFLAHEPCYHSVAPAEALSAAVELRCEFKDPVYRVALPTERIATLRAAAPRRERISFLLDDQPIVRPVTRPQVDLLRALYPNARYRELRSANRELQLVALTIDRADTQALHAPALRFGPDQPGAAALASRVLVGVTLAPAPEPGAEGLAVAGGLLIERPGWYRFALSPSCSQARLTVDEQDAAPLRPMLAGVHRFALTLPDTAACALPMQLFLQSHTQTDPAPIPSDTIVSPAVAAVAAAQAPPLRTYDGYGEARPFVEPAGRIVDFGVDAEGAVYVLLQEPDGYRVHRFSPAGREQQSWQPQGTQAYTVSAMAVAADGNVLLRNDTTVWVFDRDGRPMATWDHPPLGSADIAILDDGRTLGRLDDGIAILDLHGVLQTQWNQFDAEPWHFRFAASITRNQHGDLLVIENDGQAELFHSRPDRFEPQFVRRFPMAFSGLPVQPQGAALDGRERLLVPDPDVQSTLVYGLDGQRLMAAQPERDLNTRGFGNVVRYAATAEGIFVLDERRRLWIVTR